MCSLFGYRKKAKGNKKEGDNEVTVLTPKDSLVLHEAYQFLVKKYIPTQSRAPPKQGQITEKSTIESIKDMSLKDKKNNRKPNNNAGNPEIRKSSDPDSAGSGSPSDQEEASDEGEDHHEEIKISSKNKDDEDQADADQEDEDEDDE